MAIGILNRVGMIISTPGQGSITANTVISNRFNSPQDAGAANAAQYYWLLEEDNDYEIFIGTWTLSGTTISRDTVLMSKIAGVKGTTKMTLAGSATLRSVSPAEAFALIDASTHAATGKTPPVDADELPLVDSAASFGLKKLTWANLKAALKTTAANIWAGTNDALFMTAKNAADSNAFVTLTSSTAIATDASLGYNFFITLAQNTTLGAPTNLIDGRTYQWLIQQDATGSRTGAFNAIFEFGATPTLSTAAGKRDLIVGTYHAASGKIIASFRKAA